MTEFIRAGTDQVTHTTLMNRDNYIAPIVEAYISEGTREEKLALMAELWTLFDALYQIAGFDSEDPSMLESESLNQQIQ